MTTTEARHLARRWADWHTWAAQRRAAGDLDAEYDGPWDPHGEGEGSDCERLCTWVRAKVGAIVQENAWAPGRRDDHVAARVYLSLWPQTSKVAGLPLARALIEAAKDPELRRGGA